MNSDSNLRYDLTGAFGGRIPFGVRTDSGAIFVKEPLDYEKVSLGYFSYQFWKSFQESVYQLRLLVSDGRHNTTTDVYIYVNDVNDNAPVFEKVSYFP